MSAVVPTMFNCYGSVASVSSTTLEVMLDSTPIGKCTLPRKFKYIYTPGTYKYKVGDRVAALASFMYDTRLCRIVGENPAYGGIVLGKTNSATYRELNLKNVITEGKDDDENASWTHTINGAGMVVFRNGRVRIGTAGIAFNEMTVDGEGVNKDANISHASNYHRFVLSDNPIEVVREHFGYNDSDASAEDCTYVYRRYVASDKGLEKFTTVCEGSFNPFMGPNNDDDGELENSRESVYYRVVQNGKLRATIDIGDTEDFFNIRIDKVILDEMAPVDKPAPSVMGLLAQFKIDAKGNFSIIAGAKGTPKVAIPDFVLKFEDGDTELHSKGKITMAHGKGSDAMNSIVMDPTEGIDVTAFNGFRVNGKAVVTEDYLAWMQKNVANFGIGNMGAPVPIFPAALTPLLLGIKLPQVAGGFTTMNKGAPAIGVNTTQDSYMSC